eukprot:4583589-Ditylum_brightwellii.AAC.1
MQDQAAGPFGDTTDLLADIATHKHSFIQGYSNIGIVWHYMQLYARNFIQNAIQDKYASVHLALLYQNWQVPNGDKLKYCPIGPGTFIRWAITSI